MTTNELRSKLYSANEYDSLPTPWNVVMWGIVPVILDKDGNVVATLMLSDKNEVRFTEQEIIANVKRLLSGNVR